MACGAVAIFSEIHVSEGRIGAVLVVETLAVKHGDAVGVLFNCAGIAKVGEHRNRGISLLARSRKLRKGYDGTLKLSGEVLEGSRDQGHLLRAVVRCLAARDFDELKVVDDEKVEASLELFSTGLCPEVRERRVGIVLDEHG